MCSRLQCARSYRPNQTGQLLPSLSYSVGDAGYSCPFLVGYIHSEGLKSPIILKNHLFRFVGLIIKNILPMTLPEKGYVKGQEKVVFIALRQLPPTLLPTEITTNFQINFFLTQNKGTIKKISEIVIIILILNIMKYITLKEKVEKVFFKCPKISAKKMPRLYFLRRLYTSRRLYFIIYYVNISHGLCIGQDFV
jgi:hypothetical protein